MMKRSSYTHTHSCKTSPVRLLGVQVLIFTHTALWVPQKSRAGTTSAHVKMDFNCCSVILFSLQGPSQLLHTSHVSFIFLFKVLLHCFKSLSVIPWLLFNLDDGYHHLQQHHCLGKSQTLLAAPVTQSYSHITSGQLLLSRRFCSPPPPPPTVHISI